MPFKYSCFISYSRSDSDFLRTFLQELKNALERYVNIYVEKEDFEDIVYMDVGRLGPGCHYNEELPLALCQSICMIVLYYPKYKEKRHIYCQREYMAMETIEEKRISILGEKINNNGMIIPIILRGDKKDLPPNIGKIQCIDFSNIITAGPHLKRNQKFNREIEKIALIIRDYYKAFNELDKDPCCECKSFSLPDENDIEPWGGNSYKAPFPGHRE